MVSPTFYFDVSSPYAYLAAHRVDEVLPAPAEWQPIAFGALIQEIGKTPWSLRSGTREGGIAEVERRAREGNLPPVRWPPGWPAESYSVLPLRAILVADGEGRGKELALALYRQAFAQGRALNDIQVVLDAGSEAGIDADLLRKGVEQPEVKDALRQATSQAIAAGVTGVPTVAVGGELFWGDDRLEAAADWIRQS